MEQNLIYILPIFGIIGLLYMLFLSSWVKKQSAGSDKMKKLSGYIADGALAFLKAEYRMLAVFVVIAGAALATLSAMELIPAGMFIVVAFVIGAVFSAVAGNIGMRIATQANVRTAEAAKTSLPNAMKVAFRGGTVMGLGVAGLAVFGLSAIFIFLLFDAGGIGAVDGEAMSIVLETLAGFSLGAECIALFARVGGGIYTKAADVGADLVGKVEAGIPEDDPRNPATIADNVGDNVGDVAGMGADLFGSYVATMLAAMVLGNYLIIQDPSNFTDRFAGMGPILMPVLIAGIGLIFSIIGTWVIKIKNNDAKEKQVQGAFNLGNWGSLALTAVASFFVIQWMLPGTMKMEFFGEGVKEIGYNRVFYAVLIGLAVGGLISMLTEYYTAMGKRPVMGIIKNSSTGAATNIISGLSLGMMSTAAPIILFAAAIWGAYACAGFYGVAIGASAMMATTALQLAIDAFGPIADNAGGIAEMSELAPEVRERTDILDAVGNTTAAVGKGFAIASAALTALALFAAYVTFTGIDGINIFKADVLAALFIGGMIPVVFSAMAMSSVGKAAMAMVKEVRRQFKEIPGIMEGEAEPEYEKCVDISTKAALKEMMLPGIITIVSPIIIGFTMGAEALGAFMAGVTVSGVLWAIFQNNAGGAWDNAKKSFEAGVMIDGEMTYKGSEAHKAAVTGDTVGDPFKDTSGPSMNILIKLTCLVGLVIAPMLAVGDAHGGDKVAHGAKTECCAKDKVCKKSCDAKATCHAGATCDMSKCSEMTKAECAAMCDEKGCSPEQKAKCMAMYDENGNYKTTAAVVEEMDWDNIDIDGMRGHHMGMKISYDSGSTSIDMAKSSEDLNHIKDLLTNYPDIKISLDGYTDTSGDDATNLTISEGRAGAVKSWLVENGIDGDRIEAHGYGEKNPIMNTDGSENADASRRTELVIL